MSDGGELMRTDAVIRREGMEAVFERLGPVEAERFIYLLLSESFDYTEWQRVYFKDMPAGGFGRRAMENRTNKRNRGIGDEKDAV